MINNFPDTPGLYIAQHGEQVALIKITGRYPSLVLGKSLDISGFIVGGEIKEVPKEQLSHMITCSNEWTFRILYGIDISVFPKTAFRPDGIVDLDPDTRYSMKTKYFRLCQQGISAITIMRALVVEYNITMDQVRQLVNEFDKEG